MSEKNKVNVDVTLFLAEALAVNPKSYKYIDKIFETKKEDYLDVIQSNNEWKSLKIAKEGCVEQELYFIKALSIVKTALIGDGWVDVMEMVKKVYKHSYNFIVSKNRLVLSDFGKNLISKYSDMHIDLFNGHLLSAIVLSSFMKIEIDTKDDMYVQMLMSLKERLDRYNITRVVNIDDLDKEDKKKIQDIYLLLRRDYLRLLEPMAHHITPDKKDNLGLIVDKFNDIDRFLVPFEYLFDSEEIYLASVVSRINLKEKDIKNIILTYMIVNKVDEVKDVNLDELYKYVIVAMNYLYLVREYKRIREMLISNINVDVKEILDIKNNENKELKSKNLKLQEENERLKEELELLRRKNDNLTKDIKELDASKKELVELRNYMFNLSEEENESKESTNLESVKDLNAIVFGGRPTWISKMKEQVKWTFVPADALNFDTNIMINAEYIFINTTYINHGMYYKVIENLTEKNKLKYIDNVNINRCAKEIMDQI